MDLALQQPQPQSKDGESEPLLEKDFQVTPQPASRLSLLKLVLKVGGALIAIELLVYALLSFLYPHWIHFGGGPWPFDGDEISNLPRAKKCGREAQWWDSDVVESNQRWSSRSNVTLPLSEEGLYFVVEGAVIGKVEFVEDASLKDDAIVDFRVEYDNQTFGQTKFCALEDITGVGIGIFAPMPARGRRPMLAEVTVRLPKFSEPFEVQSVVISVPVFGVHFGGINIKPGTFSIRSVAGGVSVDNVEADKLDIGTLDGSIHGNFTVTESLVLKTFMGPITANVFMVSNATTSQQPPTAAAITTHGGAIHTRFSLFAVDTEGQVRAPSGGSFFIDTGSGISPVRLNFDGAPVDSTLTLTSKTLAGPIDVDLHPTYEGTFSLSSDMGPPVVNVSDEVEDPTGEGRKRTVKFHRTHGRVMVGEVGWGSARVDGSSIDLKSEIGTPRLGLLSG